MARVLTVCDRAPHDPEWKGAVVWKTILSLAETHHEVLALTTLDPAEFEISHPRLTLAQPAPSFGWRYLGRWLRAFVQFQPEILHTFALKSPGRLHAWPVLAQTSSALVGLQTYSTVFSDEDFAPFQRIAAPFDATDFNITDGEDVSPAGEENPYIIVPAPVSEWQKPMVDLLMLADYLEHNPELEIRVIGGWGTLGLLERREGWSLLGPMSGRVRLWPDLHFSSFVHLARGSRGLWLRSLRAKSWRNYVSTHVAQALHLPALGATALLNPGSTANFLSRLYSS